ncbi:MULTISPECIES: AAA family ATPase [unclassified Streptomyces]|uniref:uridine kinase family protein n=1 Tax=unclassified Streptomyces TaxID=2593676 RepID=UPI00340DEC9C
MTGQHPHPPPLPRLADALRGLPPSCGPVRLIAVDGHAGSGKSTFARRLAGALGGAPVLRLDDIASHTELFAWTERLRRQVVEPLSRGETALYATYDWHERRFGPADTPLPAAPVVIVEGVGAGRRALRPHLAAVLWMDVPQEEAWQRGRHRDGAVQRDFWDGWEPAERRHFAEDPSRPFAHLLVRRCPEGYEVLTGPSGAPAGPQDVTQSEGPSAVR